MPFYSNSRKEFYMIKIMFICHGRIGGGVVKYGLNTAFVGQNAVDLIGDYYRFTTNTIIIKNCV